MLHYAYRTYSILLDPSAAPAAASSSKSIALPKPSDRQFVVVGMNLENFFDDNDDADIKDEIVSPEGFAMRLKKISTAIRMLLQSPDIIAAVEVENLSALKRLADKINADTVAAGQPSPKYEGFLFKSNDGRGISTGYLVKTSRVKAIEVKQLAGDVQYDHPGTGTKVFLFDRPPLLLRASIDDPKTGKPFELTLIANHLKSYLGFDSGDQQENVRMKKRLEAEWLANFVQARQKADPTERLVLLGDFNAFQFGDGVLDQIGTIIGKPTSADEVLQASKDLVDRDLFDLVNEIDRSQRYSFVYQGNAQALDHIIVNEPLKPFVNGFGFVRVNADFPESLRGDPERMERYSDHDPAIAYFSLDAPAPKPLK